jgi:hypothetical protein
MSLAPIDVFTPPLAATRGLGWRAAILIGCATALAAVPTAIAVMLITRPDLLLAY